VELLRAGRSMQDVTDEIGRMPEHRVGPRRGWLRGLWQDTRLIGRYIVNDPGGALGEFWDGIVEGAENIAGVLVDVPLFMKGFIEGVGTGAGGVLQGLGELLNPSNWKRTVQQAIDFGKQLIGMIAEGRVVEELEGFLLALVNEWESASSERRGYLVGKVVGKYGTGVLTGAGSRAQSRAHD
jgi:hypothetical protein